jgi:hypothetical protein
MRDKLGIIDKNVGFGPEQRPPRNLNRREEPLEYECNRNWNNNTVSHITPGKGEIVCPVPGAVVVDAPQKPDRSHYTAPPSSASSLFLNRCVNQGYAYEPPPQLPPP